MDRLRNPTPNEPGSTCKTERRAVRGTFATAAVDRGRSRPVRHYRGTHGLQRRLRAPMAIERWTVYRGRTLQASGDRHIVALTVSRFRPLQTHRTRPSRGVQLRGACHRRFQRWQEIDGFEAVMDSTVPWEAACPAARRSKSATATRLRRSTCLRWIPWRKRCSAARRTRIRRVHAASWDQFTSTLARSNHFSCSTADRGEV